MIRGSAYSAILHGLFLAALFFGLPSIMLLVDEPTLEEAPRIEVVTVTPEQSAAIDKAATRPLPDIETPSGGKNGLTTDATNTETPEDRRSILQSSAASSTQTNTAETSVDEKTPTPTPSPTPDPTPPTETVVERLPEPPKPPELQPQDARIEQAVVQPAPVPVVSEATPTPTPVPPDPARPTPPESLPIPPTPQTAQPTPLPPTPLLPPQLTAPQPTIPAQAAAPAFPSIEFLPSLPSQAAAAPQSSAAASPPAEPAASAAPPPPRAPPPPPSAAAMLANADAVAKAILPLANALPRLDNTVGEILAAQSRDEAAARLAAEGTPALQQSIGRMAKAAEQGYAHAQFSLAEIYLTGNGQPRDLARGKQYLLRASLNGYLPAQLLTAAIAVEGSVAERDLAEAHAWLSIAAEKGSQAVAETLKKLEKQMTVRDNLRAR